MIFTPSRAYYIFCFMDNWQALMLLANALSSSTLPYWVSPWTWPVKSTEFQLERYNWVKASPGHCSLFICYAGLHLKIKCRFPALVYRCVYVGYFNELLCKWTYWERFNFLTGGAGKARFNVATPTCATVTCTAYVLLYNLQTKSI